MYRKETVVSVNVWGDSKQTQSSDCFFQIGARDEKDWEVAAW
jgi:hypothetical protein